MEQKPQPDRSEANDPRRLGEREFPNGDRRIADPFRVPIEPNCFNCHRVHIAPPVVSASGHATNRMGAALNAAAAPMRQRG